MSFNKKVVFLFLLVLNINFIICDPTNEEVQVVLLSGLELEHELVVEGQADQPGSNEDFIAIHKDAVGATEQLNPEMRSLMAMAIQFLPVNYKFTNVISATREVVAGVRFNLYVNALDGNLSETICWMDILEKPWITTDFGQKLRILQYTNCTVDGEEFVPETTPDPSQLNVNPIFTKNQNKPMTESRLSELESQVIPNDTQTESEQISKTQVNQVQSQSVPSTASPPVIDNELQQKIQIALENLFNTNDELRRSLEEISRSGNADEVKQRYETVFEQLVQAIIRNIFNHTESINDTFTYEFPIKFDKPNPNSSVTGALVYVEKELETSTENNNSDRKRRAIGNYQSKSIESKNLVHIKEQITHRISDVFCQNCFVSNNQNELGHDCVKYCNRKNEPQLVGGVSENNDPETHAFVEKHAKNAVAQLKHSDGSSCTYSKIENVKSQVVSGIKYTALVHHTCGGETKTCTLELWHQAWINPEPQKTWACEEYQNVKISRRRRGLVGGPTPVDESEFSSLEQMVQDALSYASANDKDKNYNFIKIKSATKQVVSGMSYQIEVLTKDDDDTEVSCNLRIWSQPWKKAGNDVKMTCNEQTYKFRTKRSARSHHHIHLHEGRTFTNKGEEHMRRLFDKFKLKHKRVYSDNDEHEKRFKIFKQNLYKIEQLNRMEQGTAKYGITELADLTKEEYMMRTGLVIPKRGENELKNPMADIMTDLELPKEYDWRTKNVVSEVKNQGSCGSCWAFSAVGNIEGQHAIKYGKLESYSEQELVDCDSKDNGCGGGYMDDAFKAIETLGGIELENEYPYSAKREKCHFDSSKVHARVKGAVDLPKNETAIAQFLVQNGPIAVALNANAMQFYRGGVSKPWKMLCSSKNLDHGVLMVGYGVAEYPKFNKSLPYWIIKNSWGPKWGEQGYYRLYRGDNRCGIAEMASSAVIE
uniref:CSON013588 protein n=1 Tax=Culicoides sonorensis TaxID=179676 RepID=A0A336MCR0_CULSO